MQAAITPAIANLTQDGILGSIGRGLRLANVFTSVFTGGPTEARPDRFGPILNDQLDGLDRAGASD
tara:strand:- start:159 stop:356 length:198 start_codon:yes stop_codon:yes gene_type:complete